MFNLLTLAPDNEVRAHSNFKSLTPRREFSADSRIYKIKTYRQSILQENTLTSNTLKSQRLKFTHLNHHKTESQGSYRKSTVVQSEDNGQENAEPGPEPANVKITRGSQGFDIFKQDRKTALEEKRIQRLVEKIKEKTRDIKPLSHRAGRNNFIVEKIQPDYMLRFIPKQKAQIQERMKSERQAKFEKVQQNYQQIMRVIMSHKLLEANKRDYGHIFESLKTKMDIRMAKRAIATKKLLLSIFYVQFLQEVRKAHILTMVKSTMSKMKHEKKKRIEQIIKDKGLRIRMNKRAKNVELVQSIIGVKYAILSATNLKYKIPQEIFRKAFFTLQFVDKAREFQRTVLLVCRRFQKSSTRKKFWISFLATRLHGLKDGLARKINNEVFVQQIFEKTLDCLYLAEIHSLALEKVKNYAMDCIMLRTPKTDFEKFHNKIISLVFYYFPPSNAATRFKISKLFGRSGFPFVFLPGETRHLARSHLRN